MMMLVRLASVAALALGLAYPAGAQIPNATEIAAHFTELAADPGKLRAVTEGVTGPMSDVVWDLYLPHVLPILSDPAYPDYVAERIAELAGPDISADALLADFATLGDVWAFGLRRLPQDDQEAFLTVMRESLDWVRDNTPEVCGVLAGPADPNNNGFLVATLSAQEAQALRAGNERVQPFYEQNPALTDGYYALLAAATLAEIRGSPKARSVPGNAVQVDILFAYGIAMFDYISAMPNGEAVMAALTAATTDLGGGLAGVAPDVLCDLSIASYAALDKLPPSERSVLVLAMIIGIADPAAGTALMGAPL